MPPRLISTPEHVTIALPPAPLGARLSAGVLDLLITLSLGGSVASLTRWLLPEAVGPAVSMTVGFAIFWLYPVAFELYWRGQTPGKRLFALRTVDDRGLPLAAMQCMVRSICRIADLLPGCGGLGLAMAWCDPWQRRLGDMAAGTMVVIERATLLPPPGLILARRQSSLDTPHLRQLVRHRLGLDEREFLLALLLRAESLSPASRYDLMERTCSLLRSRLRVDEIPGLSGEAWVRGIAALCWRSAAPEDRRQMVLMS